MCWSLWRSFNNFWTFWTFGPLPLHSLDGLQIFKNIEALSWRKKWLVARVTSQFFIAFTVVRFAAGGARPGATFEWVKFLLRSATKFIHVFAHFFIILLMKLHFLLQYFFFLLQLFNSLEVAIWAAARVRVRNFISDRTAKVFWVKSCCFSRFHII